MSRSVEDVVAGPELDDAAEVHHGHAVCEVADHGEVVADEEIRHTHLIAESPEQRQDLRLDGHVQCRDGLIEDDQGGVERKCARDADTLALFTGELVRVPGASRGIQSDGLEKVPHPIDTY